MRLSANKLKKENFLKDKKILLATWACGDKDIYQCRDWIPLFEKMFGKLIVLPLRDYYFFYGKEELNIKFLEIIEKEKPDYLIFGQRYNEIEVETIKKIKELSPQTKTIIEHGDDDFRFDDWGRYYALFFDYVITTKKEIEIYKKDKIYDVTFLHGINPDFFRPMNLEKKYDVTFIGTPVVDRYEYIKFLKEKGVNINLFGVGWQNYSDLKDIYFGELYGENYPKIINQSKINLNFSKTFYKKGNKGQLKARSFEVSSCGSFMLNEYTTKNIKFINDKNEINFRNKKELLKKINYYLKHEKEREKIAKEVHRYIIKHYSWELLFSEFFKKIDQDNLRRLKLPEINKKTINFSSKELNLPFEEIKGILKNFDYIAFSKDKTESLKYKNYLQSYSLYISKKQISCCDYYLNSNLLGDYLIFKSKNAFNTIKNRFYQFLSINQLMITKRYFLKNFDFFKKLYSGIISPDSQEIMSDKNIIFVSIPLIRIKNPSKIKYEPIKENFYMPLFDKFFSFIHSKRFFNPYIVNFFLFSLKGNFFTLRYLFDKSSLIFNKTTLRSLGFLK